MKRPASVTVFGILNILFGGLSILGALFSLVVIFTNGGKDNPVFALMETSAFYSTWMRLSVILSVIASVVVMASGVGLLNMRRWARTAAVGYSLYTIVMVLLGGIMGWFYVYSPLLDEIGAVRDGAEKGVLMGGLVGGLLGGCFGLIYPVALLYFMTRPGLVAAFEDTSVPEPTVPRPTMETPAPLDGLNPYAPPATSLQTKSEASRDTGDEVLATVIPFRNKPALIAYYLGLFSLFSLVPILGVVGVGMAIAALILGIKGRRLAREQPEAKGTAHAWVGILGGALWGVLGMLMQILFIGSMVAR